MNVDHDPLGDLPGTGRVSTGALPPDTDVAGGIVTVSPGKGGLGTFSPPLDAAGNSVRGQRITRYLSEALGLNLFASAPTA
jgi:glutaminase